jgi:extracellular factor (EF) 3-hydroxypalmitic acid methyl ester biosynthesis protein
MATLNGEVNGELKDTLVVGQTSQGTEVHATLLRLTRYLAVFEVYNPGFVLRASEVLTDFKIVINDRTVYAGRAVISNLLNAGTVLVCEATLGDSWVDPDMFLPADSRKGIRAGFGEFLQEWQKIYRVRPEFKVIVADMQTFLTDLRLWLEQVELGIRSSPSGDRLSMEHEIATELGQSTSPALSSLFEKFENTAQSVEKDLQSVHQTFGRRQLHPLLLCSPFLYRSYSKPLGYAGDYEMIDMIMRDPFEGGSLYAKIVNLWFLQQPPAEAHRNRIQYLTQNIIDVAARAARSGRMARVLSLGCGPAHEVQKFLRESHLADLVQFTLVDFNAETLSHAQTTLEELKRKHQRSAPVKVVKKSVNQILKDSGKVIGRSADDQYDFVYCAGLYDYLADPVCRRLTSILYEWVAPGGLLITTNVDNSNPRRLTMDYIMEWHLIYRSGAELEALRPNAAPADCCGIKSDTTGVNTYFEARKPSHA